MDHDDVGLLPPVACGTLLLFYMVWAAMHDIAHGDEGTVEFIVLAVSVPAFAWLYRQALRVLTRRAKVAWLIGSGLVIILFSAGAVNSILHPKYAKDPMLASAFLAIALPALGLIGYHLAREARCRRIRTGLATVLSILCCGNAFGQNDPDRKDWIQAFDGKSLDGWVMKITGYPLGENYGNTFRVENGLLKVAYDKYSDFGGRFGHIFYRTEFSHYIVAAEYRFTGEQVKGGPAWGLRNNGIMIHCQAPETMGKDQDFPISVEVQLLGGGPTGERSTANMCSPGTEVFRNGEMVKSHCLNSASATYRGEQWVRVEAEVLGSERVRHIVDGKTVLEYTNLQIGGGNVSHFDPAVKKDGAPLGEGYIALQAESHPTEFRKVEILNLSGCMDPKALNYKSYFVHRDDAACKYAPGRK